MRKRTAFPGVLFLAFLAATAVLVAQPIPKDSIHDKEIGWMEVYSLTKPAPPDR